VLKDIACKYVGVKKNLEPAKFFYIDPETGEASQNYDTVNAAVEAGQAELRKRDQTGAVIYVACIVRTLSAERAIKATEFGVKS